MQIRPADTHVSGYGALKDGQTFRFVPDTGYLYLALNKGYCNLQNGLYYTELASAHSKNVVVTDSYIIE